MKQTAVEWLIENIPDLGKYIPFGVSMELHAKFQQALELEKQQIIDFGVWYSGMQQEKVKKAFERFKKETK
jgi:hypothetical protein